MQTIIKSQIKIILANKKVEKMSYFEAIETLEFDSKKYGFNETFNYVDPIYHEIFNKNSLSGPTPTFVKPRIKELFEFFYSLS